VGLLDFFETFCAAAGPSRTNPAATTQAAARMTTTIFLAKALGFIVPIF
jgi:hypothetical protein